MKSKIWGKQAPDYVGELESRDMRSVDERDYTEETLEDEEARRRSR